MRDAWLWAGALTSLHLVLALLMQRGGGWTRPAVLLRFGAITSERLVAGQWWRLVTAVFLHIGSRHLLGNSALLVILALLVVPRWGLGRTSLIYVLAGALGNVAGLIFGAAGVIKAGASGAILGLLGMLAGSRVRELRRQPASSRYKSWHVLAMLVAFYGFVVGVRPESDHIAHVGGLVSGALSSWIFAPNPTRRPEAERRQQLLYLGLALAVVAVAWGSAVLSATAP